MVSAVAGAQAFGGFGQGLQSLANTLLQLKLRKEDLAEEEKRRKEEERTAQAMLAAISQMPQPEVGVEVPGAEQVNAFLGGIGLPGGVPGQVGVPVPGPQGAAEAFQRAGGVARKPQDVLALLGASQTVAEPRMRLLEAYQKGRGEIAGERRREETQIRRETREAARTTGKEKLAFGQAETKAEEEAVGIVSGALGVSRNDAQRALSASGLTGSAALAAAQRQFGTRPETGTTKIPSPADIEGRVEALRSLKAIFGEDLPLGEEQMRRIAGSEEGFAAVTAPTVLLAPRRSRDQQVRMIADIEKELARMEAKGDPAEQDAAKVWRDFARAAFAAETVTGKPLYTPEQIATIADTFTATYRDRYQGDPGRQKAVTRLGGILKRLATSERKIEAEPVKFPLPTAVSIRGVSEPVWNELVETYRGQGMNEQMILTAILRQIEGMSTPFSPIEFDSIVRELGLAPLPIR